MNDDKKIEMVDAAEPVAEGDPVIDAMVLAELQNENAELKNEIESLHYRMGAMGDMARMNAAGGIFAALINHDGNLLMDSSNLMKRSIEAADKLISHYEAISEKKAAEILKKIAEQGGDTPSDDTVQ